MGGDHGAGNDPTASVLQLLSLLQAHRYWSGTELADRLKVSARTLRRDVERLRQLGYPVDATRGLAGGYRLASGAHMPPLLLDDDEAVAIAVGLRAAAGSSVDGIEETSLRALAKLEQVRPQRLRRRVNAIHSNVVALRWAGAVGPTIDAAALAVLAQAAGTRRPCASTTSAATVTRPAAWWNPTASCRPDAVVSLAFDLRRGDWRTFRLDRLEAPRLAGARFATRQLPGGDAAAFVARSIRGLSTAHEATLVAHGPPDEVRRIVRWADVDVEVVDERSCRVRLRADSIEWLASTVAMVALAFAIEVEGSPELQARITELSHRLGGAAVRPAGVE